MTGGKIQRLHAIVDGRVQGVSFRYYTVQRAGELGVVGWVRNRFDGTVEVVAEGFRGQLDKLAAWLHRGSPSAMVTSVDIRWLPATEEFSGFRVRY